MEEKKFILTKNYLQVKAFSNFEIYCKEGRTAKCYLIEDDDDEFGEYFLFTRKDFLYSHSDTTLTLCHLTFKADSLEGLEVKELDFFNLLSKDEFNEHKIQWVEYKEQNEKDKEEIRENHIQLKADFEKHKTANSEFEALAKEKYEAHLADFEDYKAQHKIEFDDHIKEFESHKTENAEAFEKNDKEHEELKKSIGGWQEITWQELYDLRASDGLTPGKWYLITDYNCCLNSEITTIQSGGHGFCILVLATKKNKLNENAFARKKSSTVITTQIIGGNEISIEEEVEDSYFQYANLEAWELKYSLDNDQTLYPWCDANGKGVIWWMQDEYGNEAYYDFKNVKELRYEITADSSSKFSIFSQIRYFTSQTSLTNCTIDTSNLYYFYTFSTWFTFDGEIKDFTVQNITNANYYDKTKDYYLWGNNKLLDRNFIGGKASEFKINCFIMADKNYYTSSEGFGYFYLRFANNVIKGNASYSNTFNLIYGFWNGTKTDGTKLNGIQVLTYYNTFGSSCYSNTFGSYCYSNTFGLSCYSNTFGSYCYFNTFGLSCYSNTFGSYCYFNTFGSSCYSNTFGLSCYSNTFGSYCNYNTFGSYCSYNTFGSSCYYNTFGSSNASGLVNYCRYIIFHNGVWCTNLYTSVSPSRRSSGVWYRNDGISYTCMQNIEVYSSTGSYYYNGSSWVYKYGTLNVGVRDNSYKINVFVNSSGNLTSNTVGY